MEAPRQKLMKERATVVATTTLAVVDDGLPTSVDIIGRVPMTILLEPNVLSYDDRMGRASLSRTRAIEIAADLRSSGFQAWLVGGCVRDLILGREPMDYDISTDAGPDELLKKFPKAQLVGAHFGVVLVDGVEIATFRSDHSYADGRHPGRVVFETDPKQDVLRRDFTINALMLDPAVLNSSYSQSSLYSQVVDYVNGLADLREGVVRAIGDPEQRFQEDHLRMLR